MERYQNEGMIEGIAMTAIYTALAAPEGLDEVKFTEIVKRSGFPTRQIEEGRPFGIAKEMDRTEGTGNWRYICREGLWRQEGFSSFEGHYRLLVPETILIKAHGLGTPASEMNWFIDDFIKSTGLKETSLPAPELENLKANGINWGSVFDTLAEQRKYDDM